MGLSQIQRYCVEGDQDGQQSPNKHIQILEDDFRYFQEERWFSFQNPVLFDHNKFIFLYPHYKAQQSLLVTRWDATLDIKTIELGEIKNYEDALSTRWKYAIRRGVPIQYYKIIISIMFNKNFNGARHNYERAWKETNFNEPVPLFGLDGTNLKQAMTAPFLNEKGHSVLNELMHVLKTVKRQHFYNKYISYVCGLMLIFFDDAQTYELMVTMIEQSSNMTKDRTDSMRWHFVFREEQMKHMAASFYAIVGKNSPTVRSITKVFEKNSIDKIQLFLRVVEHFFYGYLSFPFILRIFLLFLNEGVKIFFRIFYVMISNSEKELKESSSISKACLVLKKKCLKLTGSQIYQMLKRSFDLNLKAFVSPSLFESRLKRSQSEKRYYYLPNIEGSSHILAYQDLQIIWSYLPFELKTYDLRLVYPLDEPKNIKIKLKDMLKSLEPSEFSLIVVRTLTNNTVNVFGLFILGHVSSVQSHQWYGNQQNFVFTLYPEAQKYISTRENNNYIFTGKETFHIGSGGKGNALLLNEELMKGQTHKCQTFMNEALNGGVEGQFEIDCIQAFQLF